MHFLSFSFSFNLERSLSRSIGGFDVHGKEENYLKLFSFSSSSLSKECESPIAYGQGKKVIDSETRKV